MRNTKRIFLALSALSAIGCWNVVASNADLLGEGVAPTFAVAQDDPFGDDSESDPFGDDSAADDGAESDPFGDATAADDSDETPFGSEPTNDPFAPSTLPGVGSTSSDASIEGETVDPAAEERAKYVRPEDVPDELKTEDDFYQTLTAAERAILTPKPSTAPEFLVAAIRVARVGRIDFAKLLIAKAAEAPDGTPEETAKALDSLGAGRLTYFVSNPEIGEIGAQVVEKARAVAKTYWEGDGALRDAIRRTNRGTDTERAAALLDLRKGGNVAISLLIDDLRVSDAETRPATISLLSIFGGDATEALLAALRGADETELAAVVDALSGTVDARVGLELLTRYYRGISEPEATAAFESAFAKQFGGAIASRVDVAKKALEKANEHVKRTAVFPVVLDGETTLWVWDAEADAPRQKTFKIGDAHRTAAADWANVAYRIAAADASSVDANFLNAARNVAVVATAEKILYSVGLDAGRDGIPAFDAEFPNLSAAELVAAVEFALQTNRFKGAIIPTILLQTRGDATLCYSTNGEPSTVVRAAASQPDRRLRFEALTAIADWNPDRSYLGSNRVVSAFQWFASSTGNRVAVVASPKLAEAGQIGRYFTEQGFKVVVASTGRDLLLRAQATADAEVVFATAPVSSPDLRVVAQMLRGDLRTADVPLLVGSTNDEEATAANVLVGAEPNVLVWSTPFDLESGVATVQRLFDATQPEQVPPEIRLSQAKSAADALVKFATTRPRLYEDAADWNALLSQFLANPAFIGTGIEFASTLKTPFAQISLVELVGDVRFDVATRRAALAALQRQWSENGSLLRGPEIRKMYDRYNASEKEDAETQKTLSEMLDAFEAATTK